MHFYFEEPESENILVFFFFGEKNVDVIFKGLRCSKKFKVFPNVDLIGFTIFPHNFILIVDEEELNFFCIDHS